MEVFGVWGLGFGVLGFGVCVVEFGARGLDLRGVWVVDAPGSHLPPPPITPHNIWLLTRMKGHRALVTRFCLFQGCFCQPAGACWGR